MDKDKVAHKQIEHKILDNKHEVCAGIEARGFLRDVRLSGPMRDALQAHSRRVRGARRACRSSQQWAHFLREAFVVK